MASDCFINGDRLRFIREARGMTQEDLAAKVETHWRMKAFRHQSGGRTYQLVVETEHERERVAPTSPFSTALQHVLGVDVDWLYSKDFPFMPSVPRRYEAVMATRAKYK